MVSSNPVARISISQLSQSSPATIYSAMSCEELIALLTTSPHFPGGDHEGETPGLAESNIEHSSQIDHHTQIEHHTVSVESYLTTNVTALPSAMDDSMNNEEVVQGILPAQSAAAPDASNYLEMDKNGVQPVISPTIVIPGVSNTTPSSMISVPVPPLSAGQYILLLLP